MGLVVDCFGFSVVWWAVGRCVVSEDYWVVLGTWWSLGVRVFGFRTMRRLGFYADWTEGWTVFNEDGIIVLS